MFLVYKWAQIDPVVMREWNSESEENEKNGF